jgi:hypothetical protein
MLGGRIIRWLARHIRRIEVFGVGVELREPPAEPAPPAPATERQVADSHPSAVPVGARRSASGAIPRPLPVRRVVQDERLAVAIEAVLASIPQGGRPGGLTIGRPGRPRALIYVGACPDNTDSRLRGLAKPHGYNVSPVRDLIGLGGCRTATLDDPQGY